MHRGEQATQPFCIRGDCMKTVILYRYRVEGKGVFVSPTKPPGEYTTLFRLIADEGKVLTNGKTQTPCVDTEGVGAWAEIEAPAE